jgi:hypothetical protein
MLLALALKVLLYVLSLIFFLDKKIGVLIFYLCFYIISITVTYFSWITVFFNCYIYVYAYIISIIILLSEHVSSTLYLFLYPNMFYVPIYVSINALSLILIKYYYIELRDFSTYTDTSITSAHEITTRVIRIGDNHRSSYSNSVCSICLDGYRRRERIAILLCGHTFHNRCIKRWIKRENKCPECKQCIETAKLLKTGGLLEIQNV